MRAFGRSQLQLSDILLTERAAPRDSTYAAAPRGVQVECLTIDLGSARQASYEITITVHDLVANRVAGTSRAFVVTESPLTR